MGIKLKSTIVGLAALAIAACSSGGGSGGGSSTTNSLTLSGTLSARGLKAANRNSAFSVTLTDLEFYAICLGENPDIDSADVAADGSFSVTLTCEEGSAVTALFRDKTSLATVGQVVFENTAEKDLNGNTEQATSVVLTAGVNFGNITLGDDGKIVIPVSTIADKIDDTPVSSSAAYNFNGVWQFSGITLSTAQTADGYTTAYSGCNMDTGVGCNQSGIPAGFKISLLRYEGKDFTPNSGASCDLVDNGGGSLIGTCPHGTGGTTGTTPKYAISVWEGPETGASSGITACGDKTNFTADEARKFGHIDLDGFTPTLGSKTLTFGRITWAAQTGFGGDTCLGTDGSLSNGDPNYCNKDWHKNGATSQWAIYNCKTKQVTGTDAKSYTVRYCASLADYDDNESGAVTAAAPDETQIPVYMAHVEGYGGGCLDANSKPLMVSNWGAMGFTSTSTSEVTSPIAGITIMSSSFVNKDPDGSGPQPAQNFTCSFSNGMFKFDGTNFTALTNTQKLQGVNNVNFSSVVAANAPCASIDTGGDAGLRLERYRCYAQAYHQNGGNREQRPGGGCSKEYRFNWGATDPDQFVVEAGRDKPKANFMTNIVKYSSDGGTMFVNDESNEAIMVPAGDSNMVRCDVGRNTNIVMTKKTATTMLFDINEYATLQSSDATCIAAANSRDSNGDCLMGPGAEICYRTKDFMKSVALATKQ